MERVFTVVVQNFFMEWGFHYQVAEDWPCYEIYDNEEAALKYARNLANKCAKEKNGKYKIVEKQTESAYKIEIIRKEFHPICPKMVITIREQYVN